MKNKLAIHQMDARLKQVKPSVPLSLGLTGRWISSIRNLLGMSMRQLGERLSISPQSLSQFEKSEYNGSISLKNMDKIAQAMNMTFYYGFYPNDGSVQKIIKKQAKTLAEEIVLRSSQTMKLEGQENSEDRIAQAIKERTEEIIRQMPRNLWD